MDDKIKHYKFCYDVSNTTKSYILLHQIWCLIVFLAVTISKEVIWDLLLRQGMFEIADIKANFCGSLDSAMYKKSRY